MPSRTLQKDELLPQSYALKSMNQLRDWTPSKDSFNIPSIALQPRKTYALKPRLILCHDMAGGYKEDKYIQGNDYATIYNCQYLHFVDMFI
jgi:mannosyl-glycoprotein endo-beta-N-acetylglucosaminidase